MNLSTNTLMLGTFLLVSTCVFLFLMSFLYAGIYLILRPFLAHISPNIRAILIQLCAWGAPVMALGTALLLISPAVFLLPTFYQHCHTPECVAHVPNFFESSNLAPVISIITLSFLGLGLSMLIKQHKKISRKISSLCELLAQTHTVPQDSNIQIIDSSFPVILSAGLLKPHIIISSEIERSLSTAHFQLVLMYELTLCQRYNNVVSMLSKLCTLAWPKFAKKQLLNDLNQTRHEVVRAQVLLSRSHDLPDISHQDIPLPDYIKRLFDSMHTQKNNQTQHGTAPVYPIFMKSVGIAVFSLQHLFFIVLTTSALHLVADNFF